MADVSRVVSTADRIAVCAHKLIEKMRAPTTHPDKLRVALYLTMTEQLCAALVLERHGLVTHSASHVRSMVEALCAMNMLGKDANYSKQMMFDKLKSEKKLYEGLSDDPNIPDQYKEQMRRLLEECNASLDPLRAERLRPKRISEHFGEADLAHLAEQYTVLCGFSHNDIAILAMRHQGESGMTYMAPTALAVIEGIFSAAITVMVMATASLSDIAQFPENHFLEQFQAMNDAWGEFMQTA